MDTPTPPQPEPTGPSQPVVPPLMPTPPSPAQRRSKAPWIAAGIVGSLVVVGFAAVLASGDGDGTSGGADQTWAANGVTLTYPEGWISSSDVSFQEEAGDPRWTQGFGPGEATNDAVIVSSYALLADAGDFTDEQIRSELETTFGALIEGEGGEMVSDVAPAMLGSLDGFSVTFTLPQDGDTLTTELVTAFVGTTQYSVQCQYTQESVADIRDGCDLIRGSFALT